MPVLEEYRLPNKVAVVAGDGNGFVPFLAEILAEAGARVFVMAQAQDVVDGAVQRAVERGGEAFGAPCDPTNEGDVESALDGVIDRWGRVDILVNDFRTEFAKPMVGVTLAEFEGVMDRNVKTVFLLCRAVGKRMLQQGGGRIINITSNLAERGPVELGGILRQPGSRTPADASSGPGVGERWHTSERHRDRLVQHRGAAP